MNVERIHREWNECKFCETCFPVDDDDELFAHMYEIHKSDFHKIFSQCKRCRVYIENIKVIDHLKENHPEFFEREILPMIRRGSKF